MNKVVSVEQAMEHIHDGSVIMVGGFMGIGSPNCLIDGIVKKGCKDLTIICNDAAVPGDAVGKLVTSGQIKKLIASHIGLNKECGSKMSSGEMEVELIPQGTLAERIRCGGGGMGGFLTPTGIGTDVAKGKQVITVNGKEYLLEEPLYADVALLRGSIVDKLGNVFYNATTKTFNVVMAMAADVVIASAEKLVEIGEIDPNCIHTQSLFVDYIVEGV
jgi:acetate CoA/acetoacetate CoA-transferase alpha subunit